jgi:hypothetical protein
MRTEFDNSGWKDLGLVEWRHKYCGHVSMRRSDDTEERPCPICDAAGPNGRSARAAGGAQ